MKKFGKKSLVTVAFSLMLFLAACSGGSGASTGSDQTNNEANNSNTETPSNSNDSRNNEGKIELTFWTLGNTNYEELAQEYMEEHSDIVIEIQNTGDQTAHHNNLTTALSAGWVHRISSNWR